MMVTRKKSGKKKVLARRQQYIALMKNGVGEEGLTGTILLSEGVCGVSELTS